MPEGCADKVACTCMRDGLAAREVDAIAAPRDAADLTLTGGSTCMGDSG